MTITYTPVFGLAKCDDLSPVVDLATVSQQVADTMEAALLRGPASPPATSDLLTVAGRVTSLENSRTTDEARLAALETVLPYAQARQIAAQSIAANAWVPLSFGVADWDAGYPAATPAAPHFAPASGTRLTARRKGIYRVGGIFALTTVSTAIRVGVQVTKNGTALTYGVATNVASAAGTAPAVSAPGVLVQLNVGDYVGLSGVHTASAATNTAVAADTASVIHLQCVALLP